jgi:hypothetical protein
LNEFGCQVCNFASVEVSCNGETFKLSKLN